MNKYNVEALSEFRSKENINILIKKIRNHFGSALINNFVDKNNGTGITYEAGWHKDEAIFAHALSVTKQFLKKIGSAYTSFTSDESAGGSASPKHIFIYQEIIAQTEKFIFSQDFKNFDFLSGGATLAIDGDKPLVIEQDSYIVFPKIIINAGMTACYLAREHV